MRSLEIIQRNHCVLREWRALCGKKRTALDKINYFYIFNLQASKMKTKTFYFTRQIKKYYRGNRWKKAKKGRKKSFTKKYIFFLFFLFFGLKNIEIRFLFFLLHLSYHKEKKEQGKKSISLNQRSKDENFNWRKIR